MKRIIIAGNRDFNDYDKLSTSVGRITIGWNDFEIVSGHASGADSFGERYAKTHGIPLKVFPADWTKYGYKAGPMRNSVMARYASEEDGVLIAFWDGNSRGTKNMIDEALKHGLDVHIFHWDR